MRGIGPPLCYQKRVWGCPLLKGLDRDELAPPGGPHHPGPLLPASPTSAGRRGRGLSEESSSPSLPDGGREAGREGLGSEGPTPASDPTSPPSSPAWPCGTRSRAPRRA